MRVSDFFQFVGLSPTYRVSYINKLVCFAFVGKRKMSGKEDESVRVRVTFARKGKKRMRPKFLEHSFVREFAIVVCLSFSDLWVCFGGGFQTKKWCYDF